MPDASTPPTPSHATQPPRATLIYHFCATAAKLFYRVFYRARVLHPENLPMTGPLLIAANHQSFLDPPLIGAFARRRPLSFIARAGLFKFGPFAWLIRSLNSLPIREDSGDTGAIKEVLRRLEAGHAVLIFPEGTRSPDGAMHEFKRGVALLVKRAKCPVVPVAVEGCWDAWPPGGKISLFGKRIALMFGEPIASSELMKDGADAGMARLAAEIDRMRLELRGGLRERSAGECPSPGAGDRAMEVR